MHSSKLDILCRTGPACYNACTQNHELPVANVYQHSAKLSSSEQQADSLLTPWTMSVVTPISGMMSGGGTKFSWAALTTLRVRQRSDAA